MAEFVCAVCSTPNKVRDVIEDGAVLDCRTCGGDTVVLLVTLEDHQSLRVGWKRLNSMLTVRDWELHWGLHGEGE